MTNQLKSMSMDELWALHEKVDAELTRKILAEKATLENKLQALTRGNDRRRPSPVRQKRAYPKVFPKFRNPQNPSETWAGRGKQPRWFRAQLRTGKKLEDLRIK